MSLKMKQSIIHFILWTIVSVFFLIIFFSKGTIENWGDNTRKTIMIAVLFFIGFGGDFILRLVFKKRKNIVIKDERDDYISSKSLSIAATVTYIYIFVLAISLYTKYENAGSVPVAWIWFIAYSLIMFVNIASALTSTVFYWKSERE